MKQQKKLTHSQYIVKKHAKSIREVLKNRKLLVSAKSIANG